MQFHGVFHFSAASEPLCGLKPPKPFSVEVKEVNENDLTLAFRVNGTPVYRYGDKLWGVCYGVSVSEFAKRIEKGQHPRGHRLRDGEVEWADKFLIANDRPYEEVCEPFYYIDPNWKTPEKMIQAAYKDRTVPENTRRYKYSEAMKVRRDAERVYGVMYQNPQGPVIPIPNRIEIMGPVLEKKFHTYRIGFNGSDETEFDVEVGDRDSEMRELMALFAAFAQENQCVKIGNVDYIALVPNAMFEAE